MFSGVCVFACLHQKIICKSYFYILWSCSWKELFKTCFRRISMSFRKSLSKCFLYGKEKYRIRCWKKITWRTSYWFSIFLHICKIKKSVSRGTSCWLVIFLLLVRLWCFYIYFQGKIKSKSKQFPRGHLFAYTCNVVKGAAK